MQNDENVLAKLLQRNNKASHHHDPYVVPTRIVKSMDLPRTNPYHDKKSQNRPQVVVVCVRRFERAFLTAPSDQYGRCRMLKSAGPGGARLMLSFVENMVVSRKSSQ